MKSAYELAMERLNQASPAVKLTAKQKAQLAELDSLYASMIAGREISQQNAINSAAAAGDAEAEGKAREQLATDRRKLQAELEEKKDRIRQGKA